MDAEEVGICRQSIIYLSTNVIMDTEFIHRYFEDLARVYLYDPRRTMTEDSRRNRNGLALNRSQTHYGCITKDAIAANTS